MNCGTSARGDFESSWIRSSSSGNGDEGDPAGGAAAPGAALVRDSEDVHRTPLASAPRAWAAFLSTAVRAA